MEDEFAIDTTHPEYDAAVDSWTVMDDTIKGEAAVKEKGNHYLPMKTGTKKIVDADLKRTAYENYKSRAEFPEIVAPTIQGSTGMVHSKVTKIELPPDLEVLRNKATTDGLTLEGLHNLVTSKLLSFGRYGLLAGVTSSGDFYVARYSPFAIINWATDSDGKLNFLVLNESGNERNELTNKWEYRERLRQCELKDGQYQSRIWNKEYDADIKKERWVPDEWEMSTIRGKKPLEIIPFVFAGTNDLTPSVNAVPLLGLARKALRAYRLDADYTTSLHLTAEPTPYVTGIDVKDAPSTIGAASLWVLPNAECKAGYLEFTGPGITALEKAIENTLHTAIIFGARLFSDDRKTAESGEAKKVRIGSETSTIKQVAINSAGAIEQVLKFISIWAGSDPEAVNANPNLDFIGRTLSPQEIVGLVQAWQSGAYSKQTLFDNLQRGEIISEDVTFDEEEERIAEDPSLIPPTKDDGAAAADDDD